MTPSVPQSDLRDTIRLGRIFFLLVFVATHLAAQSSGLRLKSGRGDTIRVKPGALLAVPVTFENTGLDSLTLSSAVILPSGWRVVGQIPQLHLRPGAKNLQLLSVMVPRTAPARPYSILVASGETGSLGTPIELRIPVVVETVRRIEAIVVDAPISVVAGKNLLVVYEVTNRGNDTARIRLTGWNSRQASMSIEPKSATLAPLASVRVTIEAATDAEEGRRGPITCELIVQPVVGNAVRVSGASEIIPRSGSAELRPLTFPVILQARAATENERRGLQGEISGAGSLREDKKDRLEFLLRTPETQTLSVLGQRDEFKARYGVGDHEVYIGDWNYALSHLTEVGRTAVGLGGRTRWNDLTAGGFVNQTRFGPPIRKQVGGWVRYDLNEDLQAGLQALHQGDRQSADIVSLSLLAAPLTRSRVEIEGAASSGGGTSGQALFARWNGSLPWLSYDVRTVSATPGYAGYYRDLQFTTLSLVGYASNAFRLEFTGNLQRRNAGMDTSIGSAPRASFVQAGVGYANIVTVSIRSSGVVDTLSRSPYDRREDIVQIRGTHSFDKVSLAAYADIGTLTDHRLSSAQPVRRYSFSANARPTPRQTYSTTVEFARVPDPVFGNHLDRVSGTVNASYVLGQSTLANINAFGSRLSGAASQSLAVIDVSVEHNFPNLHRARVKARRSTFSGIPPELAFSAEYAVPLAVPFGTASTVGVVEGRVVDPRGTGVPEVLVTLGSMAVMTDERGRFVFSEVLPGRYDLMIDRGTAGLERITAVPLPMSLMVAGGERLPVSITLLPSASVEVNIERYEHGDLAPDGTAPLIPAPMDGIVRIAADLRHGNEVLRRVSDRSGRLRFGDLTPGVWTLTFDAASADDRRLETTSIEFRVDAGAAIDTTVRLLPRRRSIRIIQEGGVLKSPAPVVPPEERVGPYILRTTDTGVYVQVSSWAREVQARRDLDRVTTITRRTGRIERTSLPDQKIVFRVSVGPFATMQAARDFCRQLDQ